MGALRFLRLVYYLMTLLGRGLGTSSLQSPTFNETSKKCLYFDYQISSPKIVLNIFAKTTPESEFQLIYTVEFGDQELIGSWSHVTIELVDGVTQFRVIADKKGRSTTKHYVMVDAIKLAPCSTAGKL